MSEKTLIIVLALIVFSGYVVGVDCPFGLENDSYPGDCGRYVDSGGDGLCDLSEPEEIPVGETVEPQPSIVKAAFGGDSIYNFLPLSAVLFIAYMISFSASRQGSVSLRKHRQIWNVLLLLTFLVSAGLGILLVIRINYAWRIPLPFNVLYLHVEAGIAMTVISVFHIIWHLDYYKAILLGRPKRKKR